MISNYLSDAKTQTTSPPSAIRTGRLGFTLIELLIVITIIVVLLTMTALTLKFSTESDRVRGATRQIQSFLGGARDRAIYSKEPRGVRFFLSPDNPRVVTTMAYIAPGGTWSSPDNSSGVSLERVHINGDGDFLDDNLEFPPGSGVIRNESDVFAVHGKQNPGWWNLKKRGWLVDGLRIRIPKGPTGNWYPIDTSLIDINVQPTADQFLLLKIPYADSGDVGQQIAHSEMSYEIELPAKLLPQDPSILPESVVIDLDGSKIPSGWHFSEAAGFPFYSGYMDIVFSPRGNIVGGSAGAGVIHLYVCDNVDSLTLKEEYVTRLIQDPGDPPALTDPYPKASQADWVRFNQLVMDNSRPFLPADEVNQVSALWATQITEPQRPYLPKDRRVVSIFTQTGAVSVHAVNATDSSPTDGLTDDPYYFAETGKVAK
jgi:prepilin-type N-terminal cleavage/methylation domain-containing protein